MQQTQHPGSHRHTNADGPHDIPTYIKNMLPGPVAPDSMTDPTLADETIIEKGAQACPDHTSL